MVINKGDIIKMICFPRNPLWVMAMSGILKDENGEEYFLGNDYDENNGKFFGNESRLYLYEETKHGMKKVSKPGEA